MHERGEEDPDARLRFGLFGALVAVALILHQLWWDRFEVPSLHALVILAAALVLLRPTSVPRVVTMLGLEVLAVARDMPGAGSHTLLLAVSAAAITADAAWRTLRTGRLPSAATLFTRAAPFLRGAVVVLYLAAGLSKLNTGFFDAAISCGAALAPRIVWFDPTLLAGAPWLEQAAMYGSVAVELSLPVLLIVQRTRAIGVVLGLGFHTVLALAGNVPFTGVMFALYVGFLPPGAMSRLAGALAERGVRLRPLPAGVQAGLLAVLTLAWLLGARVTDADPAGVRSAIGDGTRVAVLLLAAAGATAALVAWPRRPGGSSRRATALPRETDASVSASAAGGRRGRLGAIYVAALALLMANALSPYVGLKTESSFAMFSNLQTEGADWNHLLLPEAVRLFPAQEQLVTVNAASDPALVRRTRGGTRMVRFELERYLRAHPGSWATYTPGPRGSPRTVTAAQAGFRGAAIIDRVVKFRDVRAADRRGC